MKKLIKALSAAAAVLLGSVLMTVTACAEDYEFDVSDATMTTGGWGQSYIHHTACEGSEVNKDHFNPTWLTKDSVIIVEYKYEGTPIEGYAPVELIWQTWDGGPVEKSPDILDDWNKVSAFEYNSTSAKFSYSDIVAAYGTKDFRSVYAICVGDAGVKLQVTKMTATNCNITDSSEVTEVNAGEDAEAETTMLITSAPSIADQAPKDSNTGSLVIIIVGIVAAVAVVTVIIVLLVKKAKNSCY